MRYIWQHIATIIQQYDGSTPLPVFLKEYYKNHKKLGSRDRRILNEMAFSYYRCAKGLPAGIPVNEKIATCLRLCEIENKHINWLIEEIPSHEEAYNPQLQFDNNINFSDGISKEEWTESLLMQPDLFLRLRISPEKIFPLLEENEVDHEFISDDCLALPNGIPIHKVIPEYMYVVQDASSQAIGQFLTPSPDEHWWDCCSGAGGKSLLLKDKEPLINLTVSDTRRTILNNLKERFRTYSHILPTIHKVDITDATKLEAKLKDTQFDHIICDVPCTGSGTWARTPEQFYFFKQEELSSYAKRQKDIAINASKHLKDGGKLYYVTCSVFEEENEAVVQEIVKQTNLKLEHQELINGIENRADSLFIAVLG